MDFTRRTRAAVPGQLARGLLLTLLAALAVVVTPIGAQAYPEVQCEVTVSPQSLKSGQKLTVRGSSGSSLDWRVTFAGETRTGTGTEFRTRFTAPEVTAETTLQLKVSARPTDATVSGACERTFDITVSPRGGGQGAGPITGPATGPGTGTATSPGAVDDDDRQGVLPNAGGPRLALLGLALLLLLAGAVTARRARRDAGGA